MSETNGNNGSIGSSLREKVVALEVWRKSMANQIDALISQFERNHEDHETIQGQLRNVEKKLENMYGRFIGACIVVGIVPTIIAIVSFLVRK